MRRAETLTHELAERFSAIELEAAARWIAARCRPNSSLARIASTFAALQSILTALFFDVSQVSIASTPRQ